MLGITDFLPCEVRCRDPPWLLGLRQAGCSPGSILYRHAGLAKRCTWRGRMQGPRMHRHGVRPMLTSRIATKRADAMSVRSLSVVVAVAAVPAAASGSEVAPQGKPPLTFGSFMVRVEPICPAKPVG